MRKRVLRILGIAMAMALTLGLLPVIPAAAAAIDSISSNTGTPGATITVSASGFANGAAYTIYFNTTQAAGGTAIGSGTVPQSGNITNASATIPPTAARGTYYISVYTSGATAGYAAFTVTPLLTLSIASGYVGDVITIAGSGFTASGTVTLYFDSVTQTTISTNTYGMFSTSYTIPHGIRGSHTISVYNNSTGETVLGYYTISSKLAVSSSSAAVGTPITVTGTGFAASSAITMYQDSVVVATASTITDAYGSFTLSNFTLPATTSGSHTLRAQDATTNYATVAITTLAAISIDPTTGPVGTTVNISGNGFSASNTISLFIDSTAMATSGVTTDAIGHFATTVTIPATAAGIHQLKAADSVNNDTEAFTVTASVSVTPTSGYSGTKITVNGTGFLASQIATITFDNTLAGTTTIGTQGSFSYTFNAPSRQAGVYKIRASDGTNIMESSFNVTTSVKFTAETSAAAPGYVGALVTVNGVGFTAGATVTVTYDGKEVKTGTVGSDTNFSITFNAPVSKAGEHTVTVSDGTVVLPLKYYMDATPPAAPSLVIPETGKRQKATGDFTWNAVSDPSGVTYVLQIASDASFSSASILLEKKGLTTTEYTLTKAEKLKNTKKDAPDFWRVRAVDNASNEGNWSNIWSFTVGGVLPTWALWTLIGLGAVIILLFAFWLGRRSSGSHSSPTRIPDSEA
jgi:hypothetical protein